MKRQYQASANVKEEVKDLVEKELKLGYMNLSEELFEQARMNFLLATQLDPTCADAFWGLMLEKENIKSEDDLFENPVKYKEIVYTEYFDKAMLNANETQKACYNQILERIYAINEGDNY